MSVCEVGTEAHTSVQLDSESLLDLIEDLKLVSAERERLFREVLKNLKLTMEKVYPSTECHYNAAEGIFYAFCTEEMKEEFTGYLKALKYQFLFTLGIENISITLCSVSLTDRWEVYI